MTRIAAAAAYRSHSSASHFSLRHCVGPDAAATDEQPTYLTDHFTSSDVARHLILLLIGLLHFPLPKCLALYFSDMK